MKPNNVSGGGRTTPPDFLYPPTAISPEIGTGWYYNCALTEKKDIMCWGGSVYSPSIEPGPYKTLAVRGEHVCGVTNNGHIRCWGRDNYKQASGWSENPQQSLLDGAAFVQNLTTAYTFESLAASFEYTCGILDGDNPVPLKPQISPNLPIQRAPEEVFSDLSGDAVLSTLSDGQVLCWGRKDDGRSTPPSNSFSQITAGLSHTCGLLNGQNQQVAGRAICWGNDSYNQRTLPEEFADTVFVSISAGLFHTCAVRQDNGKIECWGRAELIDMPDDVRNEMFTSVSAADYFSCGVTAKSRLKCWGPSELDDLAAYNFDQFRIPEDFVDAEFVRVSAARRHVCATQIDGRVLCWGADADPRTPETDIYSGTTIINTRQAWVPRSFRALPPPVETDSSPVSRARILRIEPSITGVHLNGGDDVVLGVEVYGRQDIRDHSLGDPPGITFEWDLRTSDAGSSPRTGTFEESLPSGAGRNPNGVADDIEVLFKAPELPGSYTVKSSLEPGDECLGKREGETDEDVEERCWAVFEVTVRRPVAREPTPVPPRNPTGEIPAVIVDDAGTNFEVFTPEGGGEFITEKCSFKIPNGAVNDMEVIGVSIMELETSDEQAEVEDPRFITDGTQCEISAVDAGGESITDYQLLKPGEICMPLPDRFRPKAVDAFVGSINSDSTLTALSSKLYLATSAGGLNVCGNISSLSATTTVALRAEVAGELPPTPVPIPDVAELDTGGLRLSRIQGLIAMLLGVAILALAVGLVFGRRRARNH